MKWNDMPNMTGKYPQGVVARSYLSQGQTGGKYNTYSQCIYYNICILCLSLFFYIPNKSIYYRVQLDFGFACLELVTKIVCGGAVKLF